MSYARIDDQLPHDPRWLAIPVRGQVVLFGWLVTMHCYCERQKTDGVILRAGLGYLMPTAGRPSARQMAALQTAGFLERLQDGRDGWTITGYLDYNDTAEERRERARLKALARWGRDTRAHTSSISRRTSRSDAASTPAGMLLPTPTPPQRNVYSDGTPPGAAVAQPEGLSPDRGSDGRVDLAAVAARERARRGLPASPELAAPTVAAVMRALGSSPEAPQP